MLCNVMRVRGIRISAVQRYEGVLSSPTILKFRGGGGVQIPERSIYEHLNGHKFHVDFKSYFFTMVPTNRNTQT